MKNWDKKYEKGTHYIKEKPTKHLKHLLKYIKKERKILEVGCGVGRDIIPLRQKGFDVIGVDVSNEAIKRLKKKAKNLEVKIKLADVENLPFKPDSFDVIYSVNTLNFVDIIKALGEVHRVLREGGIAYIVVLTEIKFKHKNKKTKKIDIDILGNLKGFKIIKKNEYCVVDEAGTKNEHTHKALRIILRKR